MASSTDSTKPRSPIDELIALAIALDLTGLAALLPEILARTEKESLSYSDFTLALLRAETSARKARSQMRLLKMARLGPVEGLDGYDYSIRPQLDPRVIKELLNGLFVKEHRNVLCLGKPGLGKTRIAKAITQAICLRGHSALCVNTADMLQDLHSAHADRSYKRVLRKYVKPDLIMLDEFGYEPFDTEATSYLYRVVSARHTHGSIILTSNVGFTHWKKLFPSEAMAVTTVDRLVDKATILRFTGESCRQPKEVTGAPLED
jgi:DNA replication protein DnaC